MFEIISSDCVLCRLVQVRRVHIKATCSLLSGKGALEFVCNFFPHLTELRLDVDARYLDPDPFCTFMNSGHLHLFNSLESRGVNVDASYDLWIYRFYFASDSLEWECHWHHWQGLDIDMEVLRPALRGLTSFNIWTAESEVTQQEAINVNDILSTLASKDRRGKLTEVSMPKVTLCTGSQVF